MIKLHETYKGKLVPKIESDLREEAKPFKEMEIICTSAWIIDSGKYKNQIAFIPKNDELGWIPQEDLIDLQEL